MWGKRAREKGEAIILGKDLLQYIEHTDILQHLPALSTLEGLVSFVSPLILNNQTPEFVKLGDPALTNCHNNNVGLFVDKYVITGIPDGQTAILLESVNKSPESYEAFLHEDLHKRYFLRWCYDKRFVWQGLPDDLKNEPAAGIDSYMDYLDSQRIPVFFNSEVLNGYFETIVSEFVEPVIQGGSWNPYLRYRSSRNSGSSQASKWQDVVGSELRNAKINELVLTYPEEFSVVYLMHPELRAVMEKRCKSCFKIFCNSLREELGVAPDEDLGISESLHPWSTSNPIKPNLHHHVLSCHFVFKKISQNERTGIEKKLSREYDVLKGCLNESGEIVDEDTYAGIHRLINDELQRILGFRYLIWKGSHFDENSGKLKRDPLDAARIKELWSDAVKREFLDILSTDHWFSIFDVYMQYFSVSDKKRLLHALSYKCRPPVVDLDLFFRRNSGVVRNCDIVDISKVNDLDTRFFLEHYGSSDLLLSWLQYLVTYKTKTSVFGFWRILKRYQVSPVDVKICLPRVCPICGGCLSVSGIYLKYPIVNYLMIKFGSKFKLVRIWDPGG